MTESTGSAANAGPAGQAGSQTGPAASAIPGLTGLVNEHSEAVKTPDDVRREMGLGWWESVLLWTCKADIYALRMSTYETRLQFQGFGLLVLLTATLACGSMWFALNSTIFAGNPVGALLASLVYATAIFFIEREIVDPAKEGWLAAVLRGVMATIIALVISFPFEAEILKTRIEEQIRETVTARYADLREEKGRIVELADERMSSQSKELRDSLAALRREEGILIDELNRERLRGYYGPKSENLEQKIGAVRKESNERQERLLAMQRQRLTDGESARIREIDKTISDTAIRSTDPLSRLIALNEIGKTHPEAWWMSWLLRFFFLTLELMPAMMKLLAPKTEYAFYVAGRRALNQAKINSSVNYVIELVRQRPEASWREVRQVLDLIEHGIEDRSTRPGRSLAEIAASMRGSSGIPPLGAGERAPEAREPGAGETSGRREA